MKKKIEDFAGLVADAVDKAVDKGDYQEWMDLCVEFPLPDYFAIGEVIVIWGEENDKGEKYFSVYTKENDSCGPVAFAPSCEREDLMKAVSYTVNRMLPHEKKVRKRRSKYRKGGPILSLDELARQEFVFFHEKVYHRGWFASWQLSWCAARVKFGELQYAIKEEDDETGK